MNESIDNNIEILEISTKPNESKVLLTKKEDEAEFLKLTLKVQREIDNKHSNERGQTVKTISLPRLNVKQIK